LNLLPKMNILILHLRPEDLLKLQHTTLQVDVFWDVNGYIQRQGSGSHKQGTWLTTK